MKRYSFERPYCRYDVLQVDGETLSSDCKHRRSVGSAVVLVNNLAQEGLLDRLDNPKACLVYIKCVLSIRNSVFDTGHIDSSIQCVNRQDCLGVHFPEVRVVCADEVVLCPRQAAVGILRLSCLSGIDQLDLRRLVSCSSNIRVGEQCDRKNFAILGVRRGTGNYQVLESEPVEGRYEAR